jgi:hypothetical protein
VSTAREAYAALRRQGASVATATLLTAIGGAESGWNLNAVGDVNLETTKWGPSYGIWQIRTLKAETGKGTPRDISRLRTGIDAQAAAAVAIKRSQGLKAWSTYTSGAYAGYLGEAKTVANRTNTTAAAAPTTTRAGVDPGPNATSVGLFPGGGLDPLNWPGAIAGSILGGAAGVAGGAAAGVAQGLWSQIQPFAITSLFALGGIALVVIGLQVAAKPATDAATKDAGNIAMLAAMA